MSIDSKSEHSSTTDLQKMRGLAKAHSDGGHAEGHDIQVIAETPIGIGMLLAMLSPMILHMVLKVLTGRSFGWVYAMAATFVVAHLIVLNVRSKFLLSAGSTDLQIDVYNWSITRLIRIERHPLKDVTVLASKKTVDACVLALRTPGGSMKFWIKHGAADLAQVLAARISEGPQIAEGPPSPPALAPEHD